MRIFHVLLTCIILLSTSLFISPQESRAQESSPMAIIQLDQSRVNVDFNLTGNNFATFTGSVILDLNDTEEGYVELEGDAGGWPLVITPRAFYVPSNTTSEDFIVEVNIPPEVDGGIIQILTVSGTIITTEDNTTSYAIEQAEGMIFVSPAYSAGIEFRLPMVEVGPGSLVVLQALINNFGSDGLFVVRLEIGPWFEQIGSEYSISTDALWIDSQETGIVNITVDLPDEFTIWTDRADFIELNVTTENGTWLDSNRATVRVRGIYAGLMESTICGAIMIIIIILVLAFATVEDKELRKKIRKLKMENKVEKMKLKLEKRGILVPEERGEIKEEIEMQGKESEPLQCPMCYSEDVKTLLSGKFKCKNCERLFEKEDTEPDGPDGPHPSP